MIRPPPRPTLFPTPPLSQPQDNNKTTAAGKARRSRRHSRRTPRQIQRNRPRSEKRERHRRAVRRERRRERRALPRSEEHTSELQSPDHLLCPLLLEKNNTTH